ncbi:MAG: Fic family protein [Candidatus Uhrbacteria bacterium]|nr:Fic family protein [Candidatus Uhrbacteria bacterium]
MLHTIVSLSIQDIQYLAHSFARRMMEWGEPIPDFETRYPNILESCINTPFQKFNKKFLYKGLEEKAAILFYLLIKNHPFQNGNKRIAVMSLLVFLHVNKKWLITEPNGLYRFAVWVAQSPTEVRDEVVMAIRKFIKKNIVNIADVKGSLIVT